MQIACRNSTLRAIAPWRGVRKGRLSKRISALQAAACCPRINAELAMAKKILGEIA
jgi:hypothetical protein